MSQPVVFGGKSPYTRLMSCFWSTYLYGKHQQTHIWWNVFFFFFFFLVFLSRLRQVSGAAGQSCTELPILPLNCLAGKTSACIIASCACYLLLPSASAHNAPPLPWAPHAEQFYCLHKFCMIHIRSSLSPVSLWSSLTLPGRLWRLSVRLVVPCAETLLEWKLTVGSRGHCHTLRQELSSLLTGRAKLSALAARRAA